MKYSAMLKFTVLFVAVGVLFLGGCINVNNPEVKAVDFRSSVRFVNYANTSTTMAVAMDRATAATATVSFQSGSSYLSLPAGARFFSFTYGATNDTLHQALNPNWQYTIYSEYEPTNGDLARTYVFVQERYTFAETVPYPSNTQVVRFVNMSSDTAATVLGGLSFHLMFGTTDTTTVDPVTFKLASPYYQAPVSASPMFMIVGSANDTLVAPTAVAAGAGRYSVVFSGSQNASSWQAKVFQEN